jgi:hypothetical protein
VSKMFSLEDRLVEKAPMAPRSSETFEEAANTTSKSCDLLREGQLGRAVKEALFPLRVWKNHHWTGWSSESAEFLGVRGMRLHSGVPKERI